MDAGLKGKNFLITGASGGIGQATARLFAECGANLLLHYNSNAAGVEAVRRDLGDTAHPALQADLRDEAATMAMFDEAATLAGAIDGIVVNAGIWPPNDVPLADMSVAQWQATLDADLLSAFLTCREFLKHLRAVPRPDASIVLVGSTAAMFGESGHADYAAAKAAMTYGLTRTLKNEIVQLAERGRVNCVCPGWTDTPMSAAELQNKAAVERATSTMALRKIGLAQDIAGAIVMLSSDRLAGHMSGTIIPVAGGMEGRVVHH